MDRRALQELQEVSEKNTIPIMLLSKESCTVAQFHLMSAMAVKPSALRVDFNTWDARELEAGASPAHKLGQRCQPGGPELGQ